VTVAAPENSLQDNHARQKIGYAPDSLQSKTGIRMSKLSVHDFAFYGSCFAVLAAILALTLWLVFRRRKSPDEIERLRRQYLVQYGRIIDGTILDLMEPQSSPSGLRILQYQYEIAGITYESGQDVTHLHAQLAIDISCLGKPASVRYDTQNPANSIVVAETWSGLHSC